jgi:hypothetical protein
MVFSFATLSCRIIQVLKRLLSKGDESGPRDLRHLSTIKDKERKPGTHPAADGAIMYNVSPDPADRAVSVRTLLYGAFGSAMCTRHTM